MCTKCGGSGRVQVLFPTTKIKYCDCVSHLNHSDPPEDGVKYIPFPEGGVNGNVLVKSGESIVWGVAGSQVVFQEVEVTVAQDNQTVFADVIPQGKTVFQLFIEGIKQEKDEDYTINGRTITWISEPALQSSFKMIITVY